MPLSENARPTTLPDEAADASQRGCRVPVVVETPQHSGLTSPLDYLAPTALPAGTLVRVPLGRRTVLGVV